MISLARLKQNLLWFPNGNLVKPKIVRMFKTKQERRSYDGRETFIM